MPRTFEERSAEYKAFIEDYLSELLIPEEPLPQTRLYDAMGYSLLAGGKRLRPILCMEFCRICGGEWKQAAPFAAALEMIHTYSLIHDDLPSMDNDDLRRGRPTNHKVYGEAMAILAGDALLTDAFGVAAKALLKKPEDMGIAISILAHNAGSYGMVGGQVLDILSEERLCTEQEVLDIQSRKTGALLKAACALGVVAAGGSRKQIAAAGDFAGLIGLAFQIRDDMLDVIGSREELGKSVGTDAAKNTFVRRYGLQKCEELVQQYTSEAVALLDAFDDTDYMVYLAKSLTSRTI